MPFSSEICLLNDSFPPLIDGVANAVINYAKILTEEGQSVSVVVPQCPDADDSAFPYPVIRYPSIDLRRQLGYTAGSPFAPETLLQMKKRNIGLLHSHCPAASTVLTRELKSMMDVPFILTYHTKFDIDISTTIKFEPIQQAAIRALVNNVSSCDELWTVSEGAGKSIQRLGYSGDFIVMPNGVDLPRGRANTETIHQATKGYDLPWGVPLFLFVGRLRWYKGIHLILDALAALQSQNMDFRMVFVGSGGDEKEVKARVQELHLEKRCFFTGSLQNREWLKAWYSRADLMLFPSAFDTNGLVVREAAACGLGSVLLEGSCAAEGVRPMVDGVLIQENAASLAVALVNLLYHPEQMKAIGERACQNLYLSWADAVHMAQERYGIVMDDYQRNSKRRKNNFANGLIDIYGDMMNIFNQFERIFKEN